MKMEPPTSIQLPLIILYTQYAVTYTHTNRQLESDTEYARYCVSIGFVCTNRVCNTVMQWRAHKLGNRAQIELLLQCICAALLCRHLHIHQG